MNKSRQIQLIYLIVIFLLSSTIIFAQKQSLLEKAYTKKNRYFTFTDQTKDAKKIKSLLINNPKLDVDFKELEIEMLDKLLLDTLAKPIQKIFRINKILSKNEINNKFLNSLLLILLAEQLTWFSSNEVQKYCDKALLNLKDNKFNNFKSVIYSLKAGTFYKEKQYFLSAKYYKLCISLIPNYTSFKSSIYNNLSLCYVNTKQFKKAYYYNQIAIETLSKSKKLSEWSYLKALLYANRGEIYFLQKKYNQAQKDLEYFFNYLQRNTLHLENAPKKLLVLYKIYHQKNETEIKKSAIKDFLMNIQKIDEKNLELMLKVKSAFITIYKLDNDQKQIIKEYQLYTLLRNKSDSIKAIENELVNAAILNMTIEEINKKTVLEKKANQNKTRLSILIIGLIFFILIFSFVYWYKSKKQQLAFNQLKNIQLDQEVKLKEATINQLQLNIQLKNSMNKIFVDNIKSLRKQNNVSTEEVLKEMQIQLSNLVQIDKNSNGLNETVDAEKMKFIETLKVKHPDLTRGELELCGYLRLELNSKEIASLMNNTDGTVRVNKTKLKAKLGIPKEKTIEEYLKGLMS